MNVCFPAKADIRLLTLIYCFRPKADTLINQILQINVMVDQNNEPSEIELISFLFSALKEAQDSIRAFDVKAQIVGIGYIFAIGIITAIGSLNPGDAPPFTSLVLLIAWLILMIPIVFFGAVLYPSRKMAPNLGEKTKHVKRLYYVPMEYYKNIDAYLKELDQCDIKTELSYELMKLSALCDLKRTRFLRALYAAGISFILLFASQLMRALLA